VVLGDDMNENIAAGFWHLTPLEAQHTKSRVNPPKSR